RGDPPKPWNPGTTEPMGVPVPPPAADGAPPSPDSSGQVNPGQTDLKIAEVKRSAEVEAMLDALAYPRPHVPVARAVTDGDRAAAHATGPRAVPAAVHTPAPEPALMLSHSLVEEMKRPTPPAPPVERSVPTVPPAP